MKILFILHYPPPVHGSAVVGAIIKNSAVIRNRFDCRFVNLSLSESIDEIDKKSPGKVFRYFKILLKTFNFLIFFRPDLCYITPSSKGPGFYKDSVVILLVKLLCRKVVYHFHNKGVIHRQDKFFDDRLYRIVFRNAAVILLSDLLYSDVKKYVSPKKVFYCSNGIPPLESHSGLSCSDNDIAHTNGSVKVLFLSNLIRTKGVITLIEACKILKSRKLNFRCIITGDNGDLSKNHLQEIVNLEGLSGYISITGAIYGEEKNHLISSSDIMVHPTQNDCLPLVLLEAMQHSLPIVTTFEGAIPDIIEDNISGFLVAKKNPAELAVRLEQLILNVDLRERMGRAGFNRYERMFTQNIFEDNLVAILEKIINRE
jgi:glycosyltransferase involved in cell wall biosynthesis